MPETIDRNTRIRLSIEESRIPVLPFELQLANAALENHIERQGALGEKMGEAMDQSSETWHDNAPAEAISNESKTLAKVAEQTIRILKYGEVFEYDTDSEPEVTLGSIVDVKYGDSTDLSTLLLTGVSREITPEIAEQIDEIQDLDIVTLASPMGQVIFGKKVGEVATLTLPNMHEVGLIIAAVRQIRQ